MSRAIFQRRFFILKGRFGDICPGEITIIRVAQRVIAALLLLFAAPVVAENKDAAMHSATLVHKMTFVGTIFNKKRIEADLTFRGTDVWGNYRYPGDKWERGKLEGKLNGKRIELDQIYRSSKAEDRDKNSGHFLGSFDGYRIEGMWHNSTNSEKHKFELKSLINGNSHRLLIKTDAVDTGSRYVSQTCVKKVEIIEASSNKTLQVISGFTDEFTPCAVTQNNEVYLEDMNFDGYPDIRFMARAGNLHASYFYWLYSPKSKKFQRNKELEDYVLDPHFDRREKNVTSSFSNGYNRGSEIYVYQDGKYILSERSEVWWDGDGLDHLTVTRYKVINGKSLEVSKEVDPDE